MDEVKFQIVMEVLNKINDRDNFQNQDFELINLIRNTSNELKNQSEELDNELIDQARNELVREFQNS